VTKLTDYKPLIRNPNKGTQRGTGILEQSVRELGAGRSILVDKNGIILAGNHAQEAFVNAGMDDVIEVQTDGKQIVVVKRTDLDADSSAGKKMAIMDNRTSEQGLAWDAVVVEDLLNEIKQDEGELDAYLETLAKDTGAQIGDEPPEDAGAQIDKAEELRVKWGVELGQLWQLGEHRLICGDCTDKAVVERFGEKNMMVFTDPPYGVDIVSTNKAESATESDRTFGFVGADGIVAVNAYAPIVGDDTTETAEKFYSLCVDMKYKKIIFWGGNYFTAFLPPSTCWIIWDKREDIPSNNFADCEMAWTSFTSPARIYRHLWSGLLRKGDRKVEGIRRSHPTQKPVGVHENILKDFSEEGDIILDGFLGSGTTLIACERLSRKCRAVEISPAYCAVAIQRWVDMTGQEPMKLTD
jgi:16S rRNA G966 N2-methylase RsmD